MTRIEIWFDEPPMQGWNKAEIQEIAAGAAKEAGGGRETQLREALGMAVLSELTNALVDMTDGVLWKEPEADGHISRLAARITRAALAPDKPQPPSRTCEHEE